MDHADTWPVPVQATGENLLLLGQAQVLVNIRAEERQADRVRQVDTHVGNFLSVKRQVMIPGGVRRVTVPGCRCRKATCELSCCGNRLIQGIAQHLFIAGLVEKRNATCCPRPRLVFFRIVCRNKYRGYMMSRSIQQGLQFKPIYAGHRHVDNDACSPAYMRFIQTLTARRKQFNLEAE